MNQNVLPRGAEALNEDQVKWRILKLKEILGITKAGPFMYTAKQMPDERVISYLSMADVLFELTKAPVYVHYHRGGIIKVNWWAFKKFWGNGHYYCTIFDKSFSWFVFTDDNSEDTDRAILVRTNKKI